MENNGQFQVVIGTHVGEVYDSVAEALHLDASAQEIEQPKQNIVNRIIATMSAVSAPFVYILAAAGLLQGALILITMAAPSFAETGTYESAELHVMDAIYIFTNLHCDHCIKAF